MAIALSMGGAVSILQSFHIDPFLRALNPIGSGSTTATPFRNRCGLFLADPLRSYRCMQVHTVPPSESRYDSNETWRKRVLPRHIRAGPGTGPARTEVEQWFERIMTVLFLLQIFTTLTAQQVAITTGHPPCIRQIFALRKCPPGHSSLTGLTKTIMTKLGENRESRIENLHSTIMYNVHTEYSVLRTYIQDE